MIRSVKCAHSDPMCEPCKKEFTTPYPSMSNSTTDHTIDQDNCLACQEERKAPMTLPDDIELRNELVKLEVYTTVRSEKHPLYYKDIDTILELLAQEKAKWVAELESTVIGAKPDRLQPLDLGELGGEDGRTGLSAVVVASVQLYNQAVKDYETNLRKALAKLLDKENI